MAASIQKLMLLLLLTGTAAAHADSLDESNARTELGLGLAALSFPAYRGSDQRSSWLLPVPYLQYRGEFLRADREGLRGQLLDSPRVKLSLSASGSPPTGSDGIVRRQGMPGLKASIELGPQLDLTLSDPASKSMLLRLRLPLRQGITLERQPRDIGLTFSPNLNLDFRNPWGLANANLGFVAGPIFTNRKQNDYFYSVEAPFATATRPAYQASSGYAGTQLLVALSRKSGNWWLGSFFRYDSLHGAVFTDSPLVATRSHVTAGIALSYIFARF
jgi:MipA family protein